MSVSSGRHRSPRKYPRKTAAACPPSTSAGMHLQKHQCWSTVLASPAMLYLQIQFEQAHVVRLSVNINVLHSIAVEARDGTGSGFLTRDPN